MSTLAERSIGTAFEILYHRPTPKPVHNPTSLDLSRARERERSRLRRIRERAERAARQECTPKALEIEEAKAKTLRNNKTTTSWTNT